MHKTPSIIATGRPALERTVTEANRTPLPGDRLRQWLEVIDEAVERRKRVKLRYRRLSGELTERHVDPYGYACRRGEWLFVGHCHLREARRVFYLDRVQALELDPADRKRADYRIPDDFDIRSWSRQERGITWYTSHARRWSASGGRLPGWLSGSCRAPR